MVQKSRAFSPDDPDLRIRWIYFVNRKDWQPTKYSVICIDHFEENYVKVGAKRSKLLWNSLAVPTKQVDAVSASSLLRTPVVPRPLPAVRYYGRNDLSEISCPVGFSFRRQDNSVQYFNLVFDGTSVIPAVRECISIDESLHVVPYM